MIYRNLLLILGMKTIKKAFRNSLKSLLMVLSCVKIYFNDKMRENLTSIG